MSGSSLFKARQATSKVLSQTTDLAAQFFVSICAAVLLYSSLRHFVNQYSFQQAIIDYQVAPIWLSIFLAGILPSLQLLLAAAWFQGLFSSRVALAMSILLIGFAGLHWLTLMRGIQIGCGCFGETDENVTIKSALMVSTLGVGCAAATAWKYWYTRETPASAQ